MFFEVEKLQFIRRSLCDATLPRKLNCRKNKKNSIFVLFLAGFSCMVEKKRKECLIDGSIATNCQQFVYWNAGKQI
jgi:hypothetical protein